uniref:Glutamate/phenylalanine/leucine/valine/L-tryptophan dehydrogenase dimerisation domain-containing protein n=1 Tax=Clastoptera arizonana TaxID=38151 RepID=A0A1B6C1P0_9HEMI
MFHLKTVVRTVGSGKSDFNRILKSSCPAITQLNSIRLVHEIPEKLKDVPTAENPKFFDMVEYFFHRACQIAEDKLVEDMKGTKMTIEDKRKKVKGILMSIQPCDHIIETAFPVKRDSGDYEMITGYRAQHSTHRTPCKGALN